MSVLGTSELSIPNQDLQSIKNLGALFAWRVKQTPDGEAYREFNKHTDRWESLSWKQAQEKVHTWAKAMQAAGLTQGARVALLLPNCIHTVCVDQAALALGLVPVPMHALDNPGSIAYIINDCQTSVLVLTNAAQWHAIASSGDGFPHLKWVVLTDAGEVDQAAPDVGPQLLTMQTWLAQGTSIASIENIDVAPTALAAIVYTSGTTGKPKGVMLSHDNILSNIRAVLKRVEARPSDIFLSFLPLSHTFERTIGYYLPIAAGSCVAYARSVAQIAEDLKTIRPTVLVSVPRIYERFYTKLQEKLAQASGFQQTMFKLAQDIGWRRFCTRQGIPVERPLSSMFDGLLWPILEKKVAQNVLAQLGGRLRAAVCGGAPMSQTIAHCFLGMGLPLLQGYGMTETSPVVAANALDDNWPTTVGHVMDGVEIRIGENNELQVRGPSVMQGYWNRPEDTAKAFTEDGWLHTGDQAVLEQGRIRISGRIKEIMVTSTGEKIAAADLELAILSDSLFDQAMVVGENRPFISAYVVLNAALWKELAASLGVSSTDPESLCNAKVREAINARVQATTKTFPHYAVPRTTWMTLEPWTVENGLITPTLKLKRNPLQAKLATQIDTIYARKA